MTRVACILLSKIGCRICLTGMTIVTLLPLITGCTKHSQYLDSQISNLPLQTVDRPAIHVDGNRLLNERGQAIQLRGVSLMGMEYIAIKGLNPDNPNHSVVDSTWAALHRWRINAVRIPLNEDSYLGLKCVAPFTGPAYKKAGVIRDADPGHNYKSTLKKMVDRATRQGLYVILDLSWSAPNDAQNQVGTISTQCATDMNPLPDADNAIDFWKQVASAYRDYPNVMFELFNDPYIDQWQYFAGDDVAAWKALRDGAIVDSYLPLWPTHERHTWQSAGMQKLVDAVRRTGATNVILLGGLARSSDLDMWLKYKPIDPLGQTAAAWHAFPSDKYKWDNPCYSHPGSRCDDRAYAIAKNIMDANYPVVVTEFGDMNADGTTGAPFASALLPHLDALGISYLGWAFTVSTLSTNRLIKDNFGTPTDGYGQYVRAHYLCRARDNGRCNTAKQPTPQHFASSMQQSSESNIGGWTFWTSPP